MHLGTPDISVVVPVFQEERHITEVLIRLTKTLKSRFSNYQIIVVSDGSTDRTVEEARAFPDDSLEVHSYFPNKGKGHALKYGTEFAKSEIIAFCDGDLDIHPDSLLVLLDLMELEDAQVVVGSKQHPNSKVDYPRFRRIQSSVFRQLTRWMFDLQVTDTQTGLKVFKADPLKRAIVKVDSGGFAFDLELLVRMNMHCKIIEGPVWLTYQFSSTINPLIPFKMLRDVFNISQRVKHEHSRQK